MHMVISVVSFDYNQPGLGEGGDYEVQNFQPALPLIRSINVQLTTEPPLSLSPC